MPRTNRPSSPLRTVFGANLRAARKEQGLTVFDVAHASRMDWSYVHQIERGERNVGLDVLDALAQAVNRKLIDLLDESAVYGSQLSDGDGKVHMQDLEETEKRKNISGINIRSVRRRKYPNLSGRQFCDLLLNHTGLNITVS